MITINEISVQELKEKLALKENIKLIDCRESSEYEICRIDGSTLIPLSGFATQALALLQREDAIIIHCHHGGRSRKACEFLMANGYTRVTNLSGGIDAWSLEIDPKVSRY